MKVGEFCLVCQKRLTTEEFITKARAVHGDKYDYSKAEYINNHKKVCIICPAHGEFWQKPNNHLNGHGCSSCKAEKCSKRLKGKIRSKRRRLIYGVGINDFNGITSTKDKSYNIWRQMLFRCYSKYYYKRPTYMDCTVCDEWHHFSAFKKWFDENYIDGYTLDKDLTRRGNRVYCPQYCAFIPNEINALLNTHKRSRGAVKSLGVSYFRGKYVAQCSFGDGNPIPIGAYNTEEEAFIAYKHAKEAHIKRVAEQYYNEDKINTAVYNTLIAWDVHPYD